MLKLDTEYLETPRGRIENDVTVIKAKPRSVLQHSQPDREGFNGMGT